MGILTAFYRILLYEILMGFNGEMEGLHECFELYGMPLNDMEGLGTKICSKH